MRDPVNLKTIPLLDNEKVTITFNGLPEYNREDYDLNVDKQYKKYILDIKRSTRHSFEYSHLRGFLKEYCGMNKCSFYRHVQGSNGSHVKIEIHHDPFTIEDIIGIVARKRACYNENIDVPMVCKEVMYLHYSLLVGLISLSTTIHSLVGNGYLFVPTQKVLGRYKEFVQLYNDFILPEQKDILSRIEAMSETYDEAEGMKLLEKKFIYIDINGDEYNIPTTQDIINLMNQRISDINDRPKIEPPRITPFIKYNDTDKPVIF